jgi:hypothetical protein
VKGGATWYPNTSHFGERIIWAEDNWRKQTQEALCPLPTCLKPGQVVKGAPPLLPGRPKGPTQQTPLTSLTCYLPWSAAPRSSGPLSCPSLQMYCALWRCC